MSAYRRELFSAVLTSCIARAETASLGGALKGVSMRTNTNRPRTFFRALMAFGLILAATAAAAAAVDSEGELAERGRLIGNLGIAHADIGVYPDRADVNPVPELSGGTTSISVPEGAEIVQTLVYWAGRGQDLSLIHI